MSPDPNFVFDLAVAAVGIVPLLTLIAALFTFWKARGALIQSETNRRLLTEMLGMIVISQAALARCEDGLGKLRAESQRWELDAGRLLEAQRRAVEEALAEIGAASSALQAREQDSAQLQFAFRDAIDRFEQASGRSLAAHHAAFHQAQDQFQKAALLLTVPVNGGSGERQWARRAAHRIGELLRAAWRPKPTFESPAPRSQETTDTPATTSDPSYTPRQ
ncbi:MAG TPA: hypothetical protein VKV28_09705 [Candidatus Binataceae bacterium]|nr:hypothetical protein [Candidatus Binataceae bacterium]